MPRLLPTWLSTALRDAASSLLTVVGNLPTDRGLLALLCEHVWYILYVVLLPFNMRLSRRCLARALKLDPPRFGLSVQMNIETAPIDGNAGNVMRGSLWLPAGQPGPFPVALIRTPYGQHPWMEVGQGLLAERGYACLIQDTRGRFGSDGDFVPVEARRDPGHSNSRYSFCVRVSPGGGRLRSSSRGR
eukprot:6209118-Prymnesium_polylepis.1